VLPQDLKAAMGMAAGPIGSYAPLRVLFILTILSLLPALVLTGTSFIRTVIVLGFVRQGMGTQQTPPTQVIVGLALFMTAFTMSPIATQIYERGFEPYEKGQITEAQAMEAASMPIKTFMLRQTRQNDLLLFYDASKTPLPKTPDEVPLRIAAPAFVVSELTTAFQMGVMILLPFLVVDLAVASILMSMGMVFVSPTTISLPIKLILFVLADGWNLVIGSLMKSFH
jgi:flagellar biosynthetic protein FliP